LGKSACPEGIEVSEEADIVIIGSGIAGAMCAWRLAGRGRTVLVLEAGPRVKRADVVKKFASAHRYDFSWGYPNSPAAPRPDWSEGPDSYITQDGPDRVPFEYLRIVGGTTWHWGAACDRFLPSDFQLQSKYGVGVDWPFGYDQVEPYYAEVEREIGVSGSIDAHRGSPRSTVLPLPQLPFIFGENVIEAKLRKADMEFEPQCSARNSRPYDGRPQCEGFGTCLSICPIGAQYAAIVHIDKAERRGARVLADSLVTRIEEDASGRISSVQIRRSDGSIDRVTGKIFILAANVVESPRLLLASASERHPNGLANSSDQVGRNFMTHLATHVRMEIADAVHLGRGPYRTQFINKFRDGPWRQSRSAAFFSVDNAFNIFPTTLDLLEKKMLPPDLDDAIRNRAIHEAAFFAFIEQLPNPGNRIIIDQSSPDSAGQPRIHLKFQVGDYERRALAHTASTMELFGKLLDAKWLEYTKDSASHHLAGTLRMGVDPKTSVVDPSGRAHDHPNLFVAGGSIFPTNPAIGPTMTIAALSLRTADVIARQLN
jgi:glucose dehydrogenase